MSPVENVTLLMCGSFNPITNMHLRLFELARDYLQRRNIYNVVSGCISPVHDNYKKKDLEASRHRCEMVKHALISSDWIKLDSWESEQETWQRTIDVLRHHRQQLLNNNNNADRNQSTKVTLLCGADFLESFAVPNLWSNQDIEDIISDYGLVVITRNDCNPMKFIQESDVLYRHQNNIHIVSEWITNEVSSTKIRRALRRGESVKYLVQDSVIRYIQDNHLYGYDDTSDTKYSLIDLSPSPSNDVYPPPYAIVIPPTDDVQSRNVVNNTLKVPVPTHRSTNKDKIRSRNGRQRPPKIKRSETLV